MSVECSHRPPCPGCPALNEDDAAAQKLNALKDLVSDDRAELLETMVGPERHFRIRAKLAVRGRVNNPKIGIFQQGSHRIADIPACPVHHPAINVVVGQLKAAMRKHKIEPYVERPGLGLLRYVQLVVQRVTGKVQVTLVVTDSQASALAPFLETFSGLVGDRLHSLWLNENAEYGNTILGPLFQHVRGEEYLTEEFGGRTLHFHPGAFGQANLELAERMVHFVDSQVPEGKRLLEYHCGVGAMGLGLMEKSSSVTFNEISPYGLSGLKRSLAAEKGGASWDIVPGAAADCATLAGAADVVICDPPRKGMEAELIEAIRKSPAERVILVYCGFESFLRDVARFRTDGSFRLVRIQPVALFPHTNHLEVVAVLQR